MSGGFFDYNDMKLFNMLIENIEDDELVKLLEILGDWVHAYDWCVSGDTGQETYLEEKKQALNRIKEVLQPQKQEGAKQ